MNFKNVNNPKEKILTKSCFVTGSRCAKALFLKTFLPAARREESIEEKKFKRDGIEVGEFARQQFPDGVLIKSPDPEQAINETQKAIEKGALTIFEAAFMARGVFIRTDILTRTSLAAPWQLLEVKSTTHYSEEHICDLAIQSWVLRQSGIELQNFFLMHLNRDCTYPHLEHLFVSQDLKEKVDSAMQDIDKKVFALQDMLLSGQQPNIDIGQHCEKPRDCPFCATCWHHIPKYSVFNIPRALNKWKLYQDNRYTLERLTEADFNSEKQKRALRCYQTNLPYFDRYAAQHALQAWTHPISYFDLEAVSYPIPRYHKSKPYQDLPFQFSCHIQNDPGTALEHHEFLFDDNDDPRLAFIRQMLKILPPKGSIVVYNQTYEKSRFEDLAKDFPEYADEINRLILRIVDLAETVKDSVYHPEFLGSFSIKKVGPALLGEDAGYHHLAIGSGLEAVFQYQELISMETNDPRRASIRKNLLTYCKQDSLLMVHLHKWFYKQLGKKPQQ